MNKIIVFLSLSILLYCTSCEHKHEEKEVTTFIATSPIKMDTSVLKNYVCQVRAIRHIELRALEKGYLQDSYVDEGKFVRKGQLMFQIMPMIYQAETQKAQAEVDFTRIEYENTKKLADKKIVAPNELALAKAKLDKASAELKLTQVHLGFTSISAPFDGIMDRLQVRQGSMLNEGDLLTTLSDNSKMWVYFNVPEAEYLEYKSHEKKDSLMKVHLLMANNTQFKYPGYVEAIEADFNNETGNIAFRATFNNPESLLRHGETGNVQMVVPFRNALIIPQKATFEILEKKYIYIITKDNIVKQTEIKIAAEMPDLYVIHSGVKEGDKILLEGIRKVKNNDKIEFKFEDPKKVIGKLKVFTE